MTTEQKNARLLELARDMKEICHKHICYNCLFFNKDNVGCVMKIKSPAFWDLPKEGDNEQDTQK